MFISKEKCIYNRFIKMYIFLIYVYYRLITKKIKLNIICM